MTLIYKTTMYSNKKCGLSVCASKQLDKSKLNDLIVQIWMLLYQKKSILSYSMAILRCIFVDLYNSEYSMAILRCIFVDLYNSEYSTAILRCIFVDLYNSESVDLLFD